MRVRAAYISSFGTTTILVGAALLMLAVGSTIVAFRGWPGSVSGSSVEQVRLAPNTGAHRAAALTRAAPAHRLTRATPAVRRARGSVSTTGLVKQTPGRATAVVVPGLVMSPARTTLTVSSPLGARYPAPARPPVKAPPPQRRQDPGPPGGPSNAPLPPVPGPNGPVPSDPQRVAVMVGEVLGPPSPAAPRAPAVPSAPG